MFKELTEPRKGLSFWILNVLIDINFARTWTWDDQTDDRMQRTTRYFSVHVVKRIFEEAEPCNGSAFMVSKALTIIVGPLKLMVGIAT